jgi:hypothetical protein
MMDGEQQALAGGAEIEKCCAQQWTVLQVQSALQLIPE